MAAEMSEAFAATVAAVAPVVLLVAVVEVASRERYRRERSREMAEAILVDLGEWRALRERRRQASEIPPPDDGWDLTPVIAELKLRKAVAEMYPTTAWWATRRLADRKKRVPLVRTGWVAWMRLGAWFLWAAVMVAQVLAVILALNALRDPSSVASATDEVCMIFVSVGVGWVALWPIFRVVLADGWGVVSAIGKHARANNPYVKDLQERIDRLEARRRESQ
ncbi:hypothetical protein [Streptomyces sp. NPDC005017]|uniref:hypothetical protein n=1 Tax=Streptomyces sp. NPDC005017 TaxID=3364706 RepID=UPI0036BED2F5